MDVATVAVFWRLRPSFVAFAQPTVRCGGGRWAVGWLGNHRELGPSNGAPMTTGRWGPTGVWRWGGI